MGAAPHGHRSGGEKGRKEVKTTPKTSGTSRAETVLQEYREALIRSDGLIAQHEALGALKDPGSGQLVRMKELEEILIPEAIAKEQRLKAEANALLDLPGSSLAALSRQVLELRYLCAFEWETVNETVFGGMCDFAQKPTKYSDRMFKWHRKGLDAIGAALDRKMRSPAE